jgi:DNA-binding NarL/FixJ family response regulator
MELSPRARIVVVDDHPAFRHAARDILERHGYDVVGEACDAATTMSAVERHDPDALLLDVNLGDDDGFAVCDAVTRVRPDIAVILTSAKDHEHCGQRLESCGARGFLPKWKLGSFDLGRFRQLA